MARDVLLVNPNLMKPPVTPVALDLLAAALEAAGFGVRLVDLAFADGVEATLAEALADPPLVVAVTVRNIDDCYMVSRDFCLATTREIVEAIRRHTDAPVVLGGVGFSIMPEAVLRYCGVEYGIVGDGEDAVARIADALSRGRELDGIPGLARVADEGAHAEPPEPVDLAGHDLSPRAWVDNVRYHEEGGQVGFETKRGCPMACVYCPEPAVRGRKVRLRPPDQVARELAGLARRGVTHFHTCDSEFNLPCDHAAAVCRALADAGLGERVRWYGYLSPAPVNDELAGLMRRAGCVGINFGVDHGCDRMLERLGRRHRASDVVRAVEACRRHGIATMLDLLLGSPGETRDTLAEAVAFMKRVGPDRVGVSLGVRVYPNAPLARLVAAEGRDSENLIGSPERDPFLLHPVFYLPASLGDDVEEHLEELIGGDSRFLFGKRTPTLVNYNYNDNSRLVDAIRAGHRGAFWDILRRLDDP